METEDVRAGAEVIGEVAEAAEDMREALTLFGDILQLADGARWRLLDMLGEGDPDGGEPMDMPEAVADDVRAIACMLEEQVLQSAGNAAGTAARFVDCWTGWTPTRGRREKRHEGAYRKGRHGVTTSFDVARELHRRHASVIRAIERMMAPESGYTPGFLQDNFKPMARVAKDGAQTGRAYWLTRDGALLAMGCFRSRGVVPAMERFMWRCPAVGPMGRIEEG